MDMEGWFYVYPRGDKIGLTDYVKPVAAFEVESHAFEYVRKWPGTGEVWLNGKVVEEGEINGLG